MKAKWVLVGLTAVLALFASQAFADDYDGINVQLFRPSIFGGNFVGMEDSNTLCKLGFGGGLLFDYAKSPLTLLVEEDGGALGKEVSKEKDFISDLGTAHILLAFGPFSFLSIGTEIPINISTWRELNSDDKGLKTTTSLGDIRAEIKWRLLNQKDHWLGLALAPYATFPTGNKEGYLGEENITFGGTLILEHDFDLFNFALNGGYQYRGETEVFDSKIRDVYKAGAGISKSFKNGLSFSVEYALSYFNLKKVEDENANNNDQQPAEKEEEPRSVPMEWLATLRYQFGANKPRIIAGGGTGIGHGIGTPVARAVAGADWYYCKPKPTTGELIITTVDQNNKPLSADIEISGTAQAKGKTSEASGQLKASKAKPGLYKITASKEGYTPDSKETNVLAGKTSEVTLVLREIIKPTILTIKVLDKYTGQSVKSSITFDLGTDKEKTVDNPTGEFTSEWTPGDYKVVITAEGYEHGFGDVTVKKQETNVYEFKLRRKIERKGMINFDYDSARIRPESYPVLDDVLEKIKMLGEYKKIIIEGHCSDEGTDEYNMKLSQARAQAVKDYLVKKGLDPQKLEVQAYGESRPIAPNDTEENRAKNRRVEFIIEQEDEVKESE